MRENEVRNAFSTTQPVTYPGQHSDKDEKSSKKNSKSKKKKTRHLDINELPPIQKKISKFGSYGKTMQFPKKSKHKYVSPYSKKKANMV
mmetsp:Transcript_31959/g.28319  ORF Transcript_31959/g.28319 Transcript_31959/m.28319 type:complete len:89 (+) Transcript_31959:624-890(+)